MGCGGPQRGEPVVLGADLLPEVASRRAYSNPCHGHQKGPARRNSI